MCRATFCLHYFHILPFAQLAQNFANGALLFTIEHLAAIFRRKCNTVLNHTQGSILLYVTGCLEEAGVILVRTSFDEDVSETLIIFIDDINSFYNSLDQCGHNL